MKKQKGWEKQLEEMKHKIDVVRLAQDKTVKEK